MVYSLSKRGLNHCVVNSGGGIEKGRFLPSTEVSQELEAKKS